MTPHNSLIIADRQDIPLAHALLESPPSAPVWQVRVVDGGLDAVVEHEFVKLVAVGDSIHPTSARIICRRDNVLSLEPVSPLSAGARQNLRVAVRFDSFLYPVTGAWRGRIPVTAYDLSCGGVGFLCGETLANGEIVELVIPITDEPLILQTEILRPRPSTALLQLYAARFLDMVPGEESLVREAVFSQQIMNRASRPMPPA